MIITIRKIWEDFVDFIRNNKLLVTLLILTLVLSYGFTLTNYSIGIDDTGFNRYMDGTELIAQGRFTAPLIQKLLGIYQFAPFWLDGLSVICLFIGIILWCILIKIACENKLNKASYIVFSTVFASYPLINEIFIYMTASFSVCISYALTAVALLLMLDFLNNKKINLLITAAIIMCFVTGLYESFAAVYLCGSFCILILKYLYTQTNKNISRVFQNFIFIVIPLIIGIVLKILVSKIVILMLELQKSTRGATQIAWMSARISVILTSLIKNIFEYYFIAAASYLPIFIYVLGVVSCILMAVYFSGKMKSIIPLLLFLGLGLSTLSLTFIQGSITPYRACQVFAIFISFLFMLLMQITINNKISKFIVICAIAIIVLNQSEDLSQWFYLDNLRYQQDKYIVYSVGNELQKDYNTDKPVVFIGSPKISNFVTEYRSIKKDSLVRKSADVIVKTLPLKYQDVLTKEMNNRYNQTNSNTLFISWGVGAFSENAPNTELLKFFEINGFSFIQSTKEQFSEGNNIVKTMQVWPKKGAIKDEGSFIIVNFGK